MRMDQIGPDEVEIWFDYMIQEGYKNTTTNGYFGTLKTMMRWAAKKKVIPGDPLVYFDRLMNDRRSLKIITPAEFKTIFVKDWRKVWDDDMVVCYANKIAALTGMRCSEVLGLRGEYVYDDHIFLCGQHDEYGYRDTKTKIKHHIPMAPELIADLRKLMQLNWNGYLFSLDKGATPISRKTMYNGFTAAVRNIGMTDKEVSDRGLNLHAWRHFCNTELQKAGLSIPMVQAVTGHKSNRSTELYTHFDPSEFGEVPKVQAALLKNDKEKPVKGRPDLKLVKMAKQESKPSRKRA
jgi:integrase